MWKGKERDCGLWGHKTYMSVLQAECKRNKESRTSSPKSTYMFNKWKLFFYRCLLREAQRAVTGSQQGTSFSLQAVINSLSPQLEFHYPIPLFSCTLRSPDLRDRHRGGRGRKHGGRRSEAEWWGLCPLQCSPSPLTALTQWIPDVKMINKWIVITI